MLYGLRESLAMIFEEGLENVLARHHRLAEGTRAAVKAWGLSLCAKEPRWYSDTVSAIMVPAGFNGAEVIDIAYRRYDLALGAGLARMAGKLFRIGHLGDLNELDAAGRNRRSGDGDARRRHQGDAGIRCGRGRGVLAQHGQAARASAICRPAAPDAQPPASASAAAGRGRAVSHTRYEPATPRLQRSALAVPGSNPAMFPKALDSEADVVFLDLEDAVAPGGQGAGAAQRHPGAARPRLARHAARRSRVRINGIDTHYMYRDVVDVVEQAGHRLDTVLIPKVGDARRRVPGRRAAHPDRGGAGHPAPHRDRGADRDGARHVQRRGHRRGRGRLEVLHFGVADYAASNRARTVNIGGLNPDYPGDQWHFALSRMTVACRAYGLRAVDGPFGDFKDPDGLPRRGAPGCGARHRGQVGDSPLADRAGERGRSRRPTPR